MTASRLNSRGSRRWLRRVVRPQTDDLAIKEKGLRERLAEIRLLRRACQSLTLEQRNKVAHLVTIGRL